MKSVLKIYDSLRFRRNQVKTQLIVYRIVLVLCLESKHSQSYGCLTMVG